MELEYNSYSGQNICSTLEDFLPTTPSDITSLIFFYACQPTPNPFIELESLNPRCKRHCNPLRLSHVCKSWRTFVWDTSELWTMIVLRVRPISTEERITAQIEFLQQWLRRANSRPLDIFIEELPRGENRSNQPEPVFEWGNDAASGLYRLLVQHSSQWRRIIFYLPQKRYLFLSALLNTDLDAVDPVPDQPLYRPYNSLQSTSLHGVKSMGFYRTRGINFTRSPSLREISISTTVSMPDTFTCYPINQITRLTLSSVLRIDPVALLSQFSQLNELTLINYSIIPISTELTQPTVHQNLQHFHSESESDLTFVAMLDKYNLSFPSLKSLSISIPGSFYYTDALIAFFRRSGCALTNFTIQFDISDEHDLAHILSSPSISPSLKELHILNQAAVGSNQVLNLRRYLKRRGHAPSAPGLGSAFFSNFDHDKHPGFLTQLEVFEYSGPLTNPAKAVDFLVNRALIGEPADTPHELDSTVPAVNRLKRVVIRSNQATPLLHNIEIMNHPSLRRLVEEGIFSLLHESEDYLNRKTTKGGLYYVI